MIEEEALITEVNGKMARIEIVRSKPCCLCGKTQGCGNNLWGKIFSYRRQTIEVPNAIGAKQGDIIYLAIEENYLLKTSLLLYGTPLLFIFLGMGLTEYFIHLANDMHTLIGGVTGFTIGLVLIKIIVSQNHNRLYHEAQMIKIK